MKTIKTYEGFKDWFKSKEPKEHKKLKPHTTHYWYDYDKEKLKELNFNYIGKDDNMGYFEKDGIFISKKAIGRDGYEDYEYQVLVDNNKIDGVDGDGVIFLKTIHDVIVFVKNINK